MQISQIVPFENCHINQALLLFEQAMERERKAVTLIPPFTDYVNSIRNHLEKLVKIALGFALIQGSTLLGYILAYPIPEFFGSQPGVFVPEFGHGESEEHRSKIAQKLYLHASTAWVSLGKTSHAIAIFAHDKELLDSWFWQGFGLRCVNGIRKTSLVEQKQSSYQLLKLDSSKLDLLADLHREHNRYYRQAPIFMPNADEDPVEDLKTWISEENRHIWVALDTFGQAVGYMRVQLQGESILSRHPMMMNITGAFVSPQNRESGCGRALLNAVETWQIENGYNLTGVDYESINPNASHFWNKFFTSYTLSLTRRIDERITSFQQCSKNIGT